MQRPLSKRVMGKIGEGWKWRDKRRIVKGLEKLDKMRKESEGVPPAIKTLRLMRELTKGKARQTELMLVQLRIQNAVLRKRLMKAKKLLALKTLPLHEVDKLNARMAVLGKELGLSSEAIERQKRELLEFKWIVEMVSERMKEEKEFQKKGREVIK